jgi:hypothetical protein
MLSPLSDKCNGFMGIVTVVVVAAVREVVRTFVSFEVVLT